MVPRRSAKNAERDGLSDEIILACSPPRKRIIVHRCISDTMKHSHPICCSVQSQLIIKDFCGDSSSLLLHTSWGSLGADIMERYNLLEVTGL